MPESRRVRGWKDIAGHLGVSMRQAQRWGRECDLPVHRVHGSSHAVFADVADLDEWERSGKKPVGEPPEADPTEARSLPSSTRVVAAARRTAPTRRVVYRVLLVLAILAACSLYWMGHRRASPPQKRQTIVLRLTTADGWKTEMGVPDGEMAQVHFAGNSVVSIRASMIEGLGYLYIVPPGDVGDPGRLPANKRTGIQLQRGESVDVRQPFPFTVEWVSTLPPKVP